MEDLKKQTALRLAQEQKERQGHGSSATSFLARVVEAVPQRVSNPFPVGRPSSTEVPFSNTAVSSVPPLTTSSTAYTGHSTDVSSFSQTRNSESANRVPYHYDLKSSKPSERSEGNVPKHQPARQMEQKSCRQPHNVSPHHAQPTNASVDVSSQGAKSKLPHGLTVHELKEMTKARLQAEAAEKRDTTDPMSSVPSTVRVASDFRERTQSPHLTSGGTPSYNANTPISLFVENNDFINISQSRESSWAQDARADAWETASVSTATSDFYGSESAYSTGMNGVCSMEDANGVSYIGPSRSFSASNVMGGSQEPPVAFDSSQQLNVATSGSYFDSQPAFTTPNRHRAATMSPRMGLSNLHEDRPFLSSQALLGSPKFPSSSTGLHTPRSRSGVLQEPFKYTQGTDFTPSRFEENRARTSSTTSLPPISKTADEFGQEVGNSTRYPPQIGILPEHAPSPSVTGLSNVFRESPRDIVAPPGFANGDLGGSRSMGLDSMNGFRESRIRAATWSEPSMDRLGPGLIGHHSHDDSAIVDELASILKLAGAEETNGDASFFAGTGL